MAWFKVDDGFHASHKIQSIPARHRFAAAGLWVIAGSWAANQLTDGNVPDYMLKTWGATPAVIECLVNAGLWSRVQGAYTFCSWREYQPSKADVEAERAASKARMREIRARRKGVVPQNDAENGEVFGRTVPNGSESVRNPDPTRPDPTRPTKETTPKGVVSARKRATRIPDEFTITNTMREWATNTVPWVNINDSTARFIDYWRGVSGQRGTKVDWEATWRNWLRRDSDKQPTNITPSAAASIDRPSAADQCLLGVHGKRTATNECVVCGMRLETNPF